MGKIAAMLLLFVAVAGAVFAHGGRSHRLMGTVASVHDDHVTITTTEGKEASVTLTAATEYEKDEKPADRSALVEGARVSIQLEEDDKTAVKVKIGGGAHGH